MSRENDNGGVIHVRTVHTALHVNEVHTFLNVFGTPLNLRPRYNIAPTTTVDVVRLDREGRRELVSMRWGLVPMWWQKALKSVPPRAGRRRGAEITAWREWSTARTRILSQVAKVCASHAHFLRSRRRGKGVEDGRGQIPNRSVFCKSVRYVESRCRSWPHA